VSGYPGLWHEKLLPPPEGGVIEARATVGEPEHFEHSDFVAVLAITAGLLISRWIPDHLPSHQAVHLEDA